MSRPLDGMRIVDLTHMLAGPSATYQVTVHAPGSVLALEPAAGQSARTLNVGHRTLHDAAATRQAAPELGPHTLELLRAQGLPSSEINSLLAAKVVGSPHATAPLS